MRVFPGGEAIRFYRDFLGFTIDWSTASNPACRSTYRCPVRGACCI
ncbi:hypothetical protein [Branchiibius hedensis]